MKKNIDPDNTVTSFDTGGTHEEHAQGGIPISQGQNGELNLVEEGETKYGDYIFSNSLKLTKQQAEALRLGKKYIGETFADISKAIYKQIEDRPYDKTTKKTATDTLDRVVMANEESRQEAEMKEAEAMGIDPMEMMAEEQMMAEQGQEMMPEEMMGGGQEQMVDPSMMQQEPAMMRRGGYSSLLYSGTPEINFNKFQNGGQLDQYGRPILTPANAGMQAVSNQTMSGGADITTAMSPTNSANLTEDIGVDTGAYGQIASGLTSMGEDYFGNKGDVSGRMRQEDVGTKAGGALKGAASGMATGAALGSVVPVIGTAIGAVGGAIVGGVGGLFGTSRKQKRQAENNRNNDYKQNSQFVNTFQGGGNSNPRYGNNYGRFGNLLDTLNTINDTRIPIPSGNSRDYHGQGNSVGLMDSYNTSTITPASQAYGTTNTTIPGSKSSKGNNNNKTFDPNYLGTAARYVPVLGNAARYLTAPDAETVSYDRIGDRYKKNYNDEASMMNSISNASGNARRSLGESSGGNLGALSSNLQQLSLSELNAISAAHAQNRQFDIGENNAEQTFNKDTNVRNQAIDMAEKTANEQNKAAARSFKNNLLNTLLQDMGDIGKESKLAEILRNTSGGYDTVGNKIMLDYLRPNKKQRGGPLTSLYEDLQYDEDTIAKQYLKEKYGY